MVRERKDRLINRLLIRRFSLQRRQDPHAAPPCRGLFKKNLALPHHKRVLFDESLCAGTRFSDRQSLWIFRTAECLHGTNAASRLARNTNKRAEVDECRVVNRGVGFWNKYRCILPKGLPASIRIDRFAEIE